MTPLKNRTLALRKGREGSGLIFTLLFVVMTGIVTGALLSAAVSHRKLAHRSYNRERAMYVAEAGFETMAQKISNNQGIMGNLTTDSGTVDGFTWKCAANKIEDYVFQVDSTATVAGVQWCIHATRVEVPSWSRYALWMDVNGVIYFIGGEAFYGWVHSNDKLYFQQTAGDGPSFFDRLTSATNTFGGSTNGSTFAYGLTLNADRESMVSVNFTQLLNNATAYGTVLQGNTSITLSGTVAKVTNARAGWTNHSMTVGSNNIIFVQNAASGSAREGRIKVGGKLDGRITLVSEEDIFITNHVRYASDPRTNATSDDALGLVSKDDIWIDTMAPNNVNVFAAMLATGLASGENGSFGVVNHNSGSPRGNLTVWGSIVQEVRGAVGTFSGSGISTGFAKDYGYDTRFRTAAPPFYPRVSTSIEIKGWREGPI